MTHSAKIGWYLQLCGTYFAAFLFIKLLIDLVMTIIRGFEVNKLTGRSSGFGKTLLNASYNIFLTSVVTSIYAPKAPLPPPEYKCSEIGITHSQIPKQPNEVELPEVTTSTSRKEQAYPDFKEYQTKPSII